MLDVSGVKLGCGTGYEIGEVLDNSCKFMGDPCVKGVKVCEGVNNESRFDPIDMVLRLLGAVDSWDGVGAEKGPISRSPSSFASADIIEGSLCESSGEFAVDGVGACMAGNSLGGGMVYFPTLEVAKLSCLGLLRDSDW